MDNTKVSHNKSMAGWDFFVFLKGRKRSIITAVATGLTFWMSDNELASLLAGIAIEAGFAVGDYYFSTVDLRK